jgi:hypothetical protein
MTDLERKLRREILGLITVVAAERPSLRTPLQRISRILDGEEIGATGDPLGGPTTVNLGGRGTRR